jgi:hypothetical protein
MKALFIEIQDPDIYIKHIVHKVSGLKLSNILVTTRHLIEIVSDRGIEDCASCLALQYIKNNNINFFFNHQSEAFQQSFIELMNNLANLVMSKCDITVDKFHLVSGAVNSPRNISIYKKLCQEYSWHQFPLWLDDFWETMTVSKLAKFEIDYSKKSKRILCFNGVARVHRIAAVCEMYKRNILDKVYLSINLKQGEIDAFPHHEREFISMFGYENTKQYKEILDKNRNDFPRTLTLTNNINNAYTINDDDKKLFKDTVVSLVNETVFSSRDPRKSLFRDLLTYPCTFATEKFWKTFQGFHPFIVLSTPHYLKDIRNLGYRTFSPYIDESYDDVENDTLRFKKVMDEVERIANMTDNQVYDFQQNVSKILQFNYKMMKTKKPTFVRVL